MVKSTTESAMIDAKKYAHVVLGHYSKIDDIVLFGSTVSNRCHTWSDVDIAIISKWEKGSELKILSELFEIAHRSELYRIHPVCLSTDDFKLECDDAFIRKVKCGISMISR